MIRDSFDKIELSQKDLEKLINEYLELKSGSEKNTQLTYYHTLKEFSEYYSRQKSFTFLLEDVRKYRWYLSSRKKLKEYSVATYFSSLRRFFSFMIEKGVLKKNPAKRIKIKIKKTKPDLSYLTPAEISILLKDIDTKSLSALRDKAILMLMIYSATSTEEIRDLNLEDLIIKGRSRKVVINENESLKLNKDSADFLKDYITAAGLDSQKGPMFLSYSNRSKGKRISTRGIKAAIVKRLKESSIEDTGENRLSPMLIRNTAALYMASKGARPEELMLRFGFKLKSSAERIYKLVDEFKA